MSIPVFRPTLRRRDFNSVLACLVSDRLGAGPLNHELASELSRFLGAAGGACLATYGQAVDCALQTMGLAAGEAVVLSALAPAEYLRALAGRGLRPLVADVDPDTGLILRSEVERHLAAGPKALVLHYPLGFVPETEELFGLGLPVLEDISQALGASLEAGGDAEGRPGGSSRRCGGLGAVSVLSLAPEGIITDRRRRGGVRPGASRAEGLEGGGGKQAPRRPALRPERRAGPGPGARNRRLPEVPPVHRRGFQPGRGSLAARETGPPAGGHRGALRLPGDGEGRGEAGAAVRHEEEYRNLQRLRGCGGRHRAGSARAASGPRSGPGPVRPAGTPAGGRPQGAGWQPPGRRRPPSGRWPAPGICWPAASCFPSIRRC